MCAEKCVILLSPALPIGMAANTAAVLSVTLGRLRPDTVGADVRDQEGGVHRGIITFPICAGRRRRSGSPPWTSPTSPKSAEPMRSILRGWAIPRRRHCAT